MNYIIFLPGSSSLGAEWIRVAYIAEKHHPLGFKQHPLEYFFWEYKV